MTVLQAVLIGVVVAVAPPLAWSGGSTEENLRCREGVEIEPIEDLKRVFDPSFIRPDEDTDEIVLCFVRYSKVPYSIFRVEWDHRNVIEVGINLGTSDGFRWFKSYREVKPPSSDRWRLSVDHPVSSSIIPSPADPDDPAYQNFTASLLNLIIEIQQDDARVQFGIVR